MPAKHSCMIILQLSLKAAVVLCLASSSSTNTRPSSVSQSSAVFDEVSNSRRIVDDSRHSVASNRTTVLPPSILATAPTTHQSSTLNSIMTKKDDEPSALSKLVRRIRVFRLAGRVFWSYKMVQRKEKKIRRRLGLSEEGDKDDDHPEIVELWDEAHQENADRMLAAIEQLQGFWIKMGQYISSRADVMPRQYLQTLASLQDGVPPKPFAEIEQTLSEQLPPQALAMLEEIDPEPLSTASLAQVHRATLKSGQEVVIKAQHRGVSSLMIQDMDNLRTILYLLSKFEPDMDYNPVVDEYTKEVRKELDFRTEAENMAVVKDLLEHRNVRAVVPAAIPGLVTEKVLVMEYCEGFPVRDTKSLDLHNVNRKLLLERVCTAWAAQMHIGGTFNADPHPGNILVSTNQDDGDSSVPVLLDFGLAKRLEQVMKIAFARLVHSSYETDVDGLLQSFDEMGLKLNRYDPFQDMQVMQAVFADPTPQSEVSEVKKQKAKDSKERQEAMREDQGLKKGQKLRNPIDAWPSELIFFTRVGAMLRGLCSRLEVRYPYLACMSEAAGEVLRAAIPEHEHAVGTVYESPTGETYDSTLQQKLQDVALELIEEDHAIGMQVCVMQKGKMVANVAAGTLGAVNPRPVTPASLFNVFSVSKAVLATGVLRLLEERGISVDDPVATYWPRFGASVPEKKLVTIRHALSHQAGLANAFPSNASIETLTDWEHMKEFIAGPDAVPSHKPGEETHYHYLTFAWILGGLIEEVTGQPYEQYLMEHLIQPLGLENEMHMGGLPDEVAREELAVLTARTLRDTVDDQMDKDGEQSQQNTIDRQKMSSEAKSRLAKFQGREQMMNPSVFNMRKVRSAKIPSANGHMSATSLATLMSAVTASEGKIVSSTTMEKACTPQKSSSAARGSSVMLDNAGASFGLGYQIHEMKKLDTGSTVRSLGHSGFGGSIVISIPEEELTIAFTTNQLKLKSVARTRVLTAVFEERGLEPPKSLIDS